MEKSIAYQKLESCVNNLKESGCSFLSLRGMNSEHNVKRLWDTILLNTRGVLPKSLLLNSLIEIYQSIYANYPENIFWDIDALIARILFEAVEDTDPEAAYKDRHTLLIEILEMFGSKGAIQFRYIHDFIYGFDWARWVKRESSSRRNTCPFSFSFMKRMKQRGTELIELISHNDKKYHKLSSGYRNPFTFVREPEQEMALFRELAALKLLPVTAWSFSCCCTWEAEFEEIRKAHAVEK